MLTNYTLSFRVRFYYGILLEFSIVFFELD